MAAIGARDAVLAFKALGLDVVPTDSARECAAAVLQMARDGYAVIFMTEEAMAQIPETLARFAAQPLPAIIPIPGPGGSRGLGMQALRANVEKAVGSDILFRNEG